MEKPLNFDPPAVADASLVGTYPARAGAGGGYVWDEVLEYRVWCDPDASTGDLDGGSDYFYAFATFAEAEAFARATFGSGAPLALVLQREYVEEFEAGQYQHIRQERRAEWPVEFLSRPRRTADTIPSFLSSGPPPDLMLLRGTPD